MSGRKCSYLAIQHCKSEIDSYLKNKGESDLSKYKVYIIDDNLFFDKWEYNNIAKPVIDLTPKTINYYDLYTRKLIVNIGENKKNEKIYLNVEGDKVPANYIDKQNRHVQKIIEAYESVGGQWNAIESGSGLYSSNGVIIIDNQAGRRKFTGTLHIIIMWYKIEDTGLQSVSMKTKYYKIPENYR